MIIVHHVAKNTEVENNYSIKKRKKEGDTVTHLGDLLSKGNSNFFETPGACLVV